MDDYIPFEGVLKSRTLTPEEAERHRERLERALDRRKNDMTNEGIGG